MLPWNSSPMPCWKISKTRMNSANLTSWIICFKIIFLLFQYHFHLHEDWNVFNEIYFQSAKFYSTSLRVWYCSEYVIDQCSQKKMHLKVHMTQDIGNESYLQILYFHNNCNFSFCQKHIYVYLSTKTTSFRGNEFAVFVLREQGY